MKAAGYMCKEASTTFKLDEIRADRYTCKEAREAGHSLPEIREAGYTCKEARETGYTLTEIKEAGYVEGLKDAGYTCHICKEAGYRPMECKKGGFTYEEADAVGYPGTKKGWDNGNEDKHNNGWIF